MRRLLVGFVAFALTAEAAPVKAEEPLSLSEVLAQVTQEHPLALTAQAQVAETDALAFSTRGAFDLRAEANGSYAPLGKYGMPYGSVGLKQPTTWSGVKLWTKYENGADFAPYQGGSVTSEWGKVSAGVLLPLLRGRAIDPARLKRYVAEAKSLIAREDQRQTQANLLSSAAVTWWQWVTAGKKLDAYRSLVRQAELRQEFIREQVVSGALSEVELEDNERVLAQRRAKLAEVEYRFVEKSLSLALFRRDERGNPQPPKADEVPDLPHLVGSALQHKSGRAEDLLTTPEIRIYDLALQIITKEVQGAGNETLPRLDLEVLGAQSFGATRPYSDLDRSVTETAVGGRLSFSWDVQRRTARGRKAALRAKRRILEQARRLSLDQARLKLRAQEAALEAELRAAQLSQKATRHAKKVSSAERTSFELGQSSVLAVNLREQAFLGTYISELDAILEFQLAWIARQRQLGRTSFHDYLPPKLRLAP